MKTPLLDRMYSNLEAGRPIDYEEEAAAPMPAPVASEPQSDFDWGSAIMGLGPALLGAFTGSAGAKAAKDTTDTSMKMWQDSAKAKAEAKREASKLAREDQKEAQREKRALETEDRRDMRQERTLAAQEERFNRTLAAREGSPAGEFKKLPKETQIQIEDSAKNIQKIVPIKSQFDALLLQLEDPNISEGQKLQAAQNAAKLINSPLGADAVGEGEAKRVLAFLDPAPQLWGAKGMKLGPDLAGFTEAIRLNKDRLGTSMEMLESNIDRAYGRPVDKKKQMSPSDEQAIKWAQDNPKDPRSAQILKMHGM